MRRAVITLVFASVTLSLWARDRATLSGKIFDRAGHSIDHVTVLVYRAGVKNGYSTFCPSCYADCGKKTLTDSNGAFVIKGVDPDLWFDLLAVRDGFEPVIVKKVDPLRPASPETTLLPRPVAVAPDRVVRGRVVDELGAPLPDVVVQPIGLSSNESPDGTPGRREVSRYGTVDGLEPIAVTDRSGNFEIANRKPALGMLLKFEARGFAPKLAALPTGSNRTNVPVARGAVLRGRLIDRGAPVAGAQIGLIARNRGGFGANLKVIGDPYEEIRVGTQADGSFVLAGVPSQVEWYVYAKMSSLSNGRAMTPVECTTKRPGEVISVGDLQLATGHRLRGRVTLQDRATLPDGMRINLFSDEAWDSKIVLLNADGSFEFSGLPTGEYDISPAVRGYSLAEPVRHMSIDRDVDSFNLVLEPAKRP